MFLVTVFLKLVRFIKENVFGPIFRVFLKLHYRKTNKLKPLPECTSEYLLMPAHKLTEKIRNREIKCSELIKLYIKRIQEIQPYLNCVVKTCYEEALEEAKKIDDLLESPTLPEKYSIKNAPLLGVPFSCKECLWVKGMPNSTGIVERKDFKAPEDADVVKYMREAGAILTCLTNTSEGCMWYESSNYLYGTTKNPYNLSRIPGGSSGGEGAIIGGAGSVVGLAADIGGSIRIPSYFNCIYGHKPSQNIISNNTQHPVFTGIVENMLGTGPICRYASDIRFMFKVMAGPNYEQIASSFETNVDFKKIQFYTIKELTNNLLVTSMSKDAKATLNKAISFVEKSFNKEVKELKLEELEYTFDMWNAIFLNGQRNSDEKSYILADHKCKINLFSEFLKSVFFLQKKHTFASLCVAIVERFPIKKQQHFLDLGNKFRDQVKGILGNDGILLIPSFSTAVPYHNQTVLLNTFDNLYFALVNVLQMPSTQCPIGLDSESLPTGIQIVANDKMDHLTIQLAEYFEKNFSGWIPPF